MQNLALAVFFSFRNIVPFLNVPQPGENTAGCFCRNLLTCCMIEFVCMFFMVFPGTFDASIIRDQTPKDSNQLRPITACPFSTISISKYRVAFVCILQASVSLCLTI